MYVLNNDFNYCKITLRKMCFRGIKQNLGEVRLNDTFYKTVSIQADSPTVLNIHPTFIRILI